MNALEYVLVFVFGTCIGSFLNVVIWRLPREEALSGRSHCAKCGHKLKAHDLFPLLSYLALAGKCRYCKASISLRYPIIEALTGLLFLLPFYFYQPQNVLSWLIFIKVVIALSILVSVFVIDLEHYLILDTVVFPGVVILTLLNLSLDFFSVNGFWHLSSYTLGGILGAFAASLPFFLIWFFSKGKWMGFGDVKLAVFLGVFLGTKLALVSIFAAITLGGILSLFLLVFAGKSMKSKLPFGTFLSVGALASLFWGERLLLWYLGFLGL